VLRRGRSARSDCRWKTPRIGNAHAFHEAPAEPVLAAFEPKRGTRPKGGPRRRARRRRQGRQRRTVSFTRGGRKRRPARRYRALKWEARREARFSPVSSASGGPSLQVPAPRVFGRAGEHAKKTLAWASTEPQGSGTRAVLGRAPKGLARDSIAALGSDEKHECSSGNGFGVQKSIGRIAGRDARGRYQAHQGHARSSSKETPNRA
jgi:hypothetical protein